MDVAKAVLEVAVSDRPGHVARRERLTRAQFLPFMTQQPEVTVFTGRPSHHAATVVGTSTARKAPQCIAAVQAARPCSSPRADSQFAGTRAKGNKNSTPAMNSNAFHFAANPPVACRGPGRCPGAAGSWLGVSSMASN